MLRDRRRYRDLGVAAVIPARMGRSSGLVRHAATAPLRAMPVIGGRETDGGSVAAPASRADGYGERDAPRHVLPGCPGGAAMPLTRTTAVMPTAIAPTTEKMVCQTGEGMAIWAMPWVAL